MASYAHLPDYDKMGPFLVGTGVLEPSLRLDWLLLDFGRRSADLDSAAQTLSCRESPVQPQAAKRGIGGPEIVLRFRCQPRPGRGSRDGTEGCNRSGTGHWHPQRHRTRLGDRYPPRAPGRIATAIRHRQRTPRRARRRSAACAGDRDLSCFPAGGCVTLVPALPAGLPASVDSMPQQAVSTRPDLSAKFAHVRACEAELERARADYLPKLSANGTLGRVYRELDSIDLGPNGTTFYPKKTTAGIGLQLSWELFDGFIRE